jgi:hypothetical protein
MGGLQHPTWDAFVYSLKTLASMNYYLIFMTSTRFTRTQFNARPSLCFGLRCCNGCDASLGAAGTAQHHAKVATIERRSQRAAARPRAPPFGRLLLGRALSPARLLLIASAQQHAPARLPLAPYFRAGPSHLCASFWQPARSSTPPRAWLVLRPAKQHRAVLSRAAWLLRRSTHKRARRCDAVPRPRRQASCPWPQRNSAPGALSEPTQPSNESLWATSRVAAN